jgi:hypothetical protein
MQTQFDFAGSTYQREALRFGLIGDSAPNIDLSSYLMQFHAGKAKFTAGHVAYNSNRHLVNNFSSRGLMLNLPVTSRGEFTLAGMNGTSIVGWDNFFGLSRRNHSMVAGSLGFELIPARPGALRIESGVLTGSLLPLSSYSQGNVNDAERSKGLSLRVLASDPTQRLQVEGGFARSRFHNPFDPLLSPDGGGVAVRETSRNARYLEAGYSILRNAGFGGDRTADLRLNYRHEQVDPLYRTVAAYVQPNRFQNQVELVATVAGVSATASYLRFNDNLDNLPSILKSLTRRTNVVVGAPLLSLIGGQPQRAAWLPRVSYTFDRTHQFGAFIPTNSGFNPSGNQVPDQIGTNQGAVAEWQSGRFRYGYRFNHSAQNNFGGNREAAKLNNIVHGGTFGLSLASLDVNLDVNAESLNSLDNNANKDRDRTDRTTRFAMNLNWRMTRSAVLAVNLSNTSLSSFGDLSLRNDGRNTEFDVQWSWRFGIERSRMKKVQGQFFVRYANRYARSTSELYLFNNVLKSQTLNTGLSFTFF